MTGIIIKHRYEDKVLYEAPTAETIRDAVNEAVADGANLEGANLRVANLEGAYLRGANLRGANLEGAYLRGAYLRGAYLDGAYLRGAYLRGANLEGADLRGEYLYGAYLEGAYLEGAYLRGANLDGATLLPTGETWDEYLTQVVPALLTAGRRELAAVATKETWDCHTWQNCPMAEAFSTHDLGGVPILLRPRADQFIQFFDARLIPLEAVLGTVVAS